MQIYKKSNDVKLLLAIYNFFVKNEFYFNFKSPYNLLFFLHLTFIIIFVQN